MWTYIIAAIVALGLLAGIITWADRNIETTAGVRKGEANTKKKWDDANEAARVASAKVDLHNLRNKERADAQSLKERSDLAGVYDAYRSLRDQRRVGSLLPAAAPDAASPATASFDRSALDRGMAEADGVLQSGAEKILRRGDEAIVDLNTARAWAQKR